jgi:cellulose synthase/poly-beta-1,6-N-acetylglucosamine synthase-like glycosyltransferase
MNRLSPLGFAQTLLDVLLLSLSSFLAVLCLLLLLEALAFLVNQSPGWRQRGKWRLPIGMPDHVTAVVVIPAHNEALGIARTLAPLTELRYPIVVVADNCDDETTMVARSLGATVIERHNLEARGKGYAMDFGLDYLRPNPPDVVVFIDADCLISVAGVRRLVMKAIVTQRPVQAAYRMLLPPEPSTKDRVSAFAFAFKNLVRMQGLSRLGGAIVLAGSGMAFPWATLQVVDLASGAIVEDMKLGIDLAIAGTPALLCPEVLVTSLLPQQTQAAQTQRTRWEHGHLQSIGAYVPGLLGRSLWPPRGDLFLMAWDLCVPPLSLLVTAWILALGLTGAAVAMGLGPMASMALWLVLVAGVMLTIATGIGWNAVGRSDLPWHKLIKIPVYVLSKLPLYGKFVAKPQQAWERTERDPVESR